MTIDLVRLDDRLIHGQVVVGWGRSLNPKLIVVIDDAIADSEWERDLYRTGVPASIQVAFCSVAEASSEVAGWAESPAKTIVLIGEVETLFALCCHAPSITSVNLGGLHEGNGRSQRLPYLFLSDHDIALLQQLADRGVTITAQDLPTTSPVPLEEVP